MKKTDTNTPIISKEDIPEFIGQVIDIFEDFLAEKGIEVPNSEKEDNRHGYDNPDEEMAILYGSDYSEIQTALEELFKKLEHYKILKQQNEEKKDGTK